MQSSRSRSGPSEMPPKTSPSAPSSKRFSSPNLCRSSSVSSSADSRNSRISERKPSPKRQPSHEKQISVLVSEKQQQWGQLQQELKKAREELAELEKMNEASKQIKDRMKLLESVAETAKESESKMLESLFSQTKQLEQTKILLEEAKLEIRNLQEEKGSLTYSHAQDEIKNLRTELRLALEAEEKSRKAMDDLAIALKEVTSELAVTKSELANARASNPSFTGQKLHDVLEDYHKLKLRYDESAIAWKEQEYRLINSAKVFEEEVNMKDEKHRISKEETSKLRNIIKQAVNEATVARNSVEIARRENYELNQQLLKKEKALQQIMQDYESLRAWEATGPLASSSYLNAESISQSKAPNDDRKISKSTREYHSDRWLNMKQMAPNGHRHSIGESDAVLGTVSAAPSIRVPSSLFNDGRRLRSIGFDHLDGMLFSDAVEDKKKKKTALRRFGEVLRRRSFRKSLKN